ncbi:MAG TPA: PHB depolymerase family esterase [Acidimicrobiales bacterium]|nr:PHB depolymerase family esterase [Acidimicrobiales bacterium]
MTSAQPDLGFRYRHRPPAGGDERPRNTLLLLHGAGGDESSLWHLGEAFPPDVALLSPRGQVEEDGPRYFRRTAPAAPDAEDLEARVEELAGFVSGACTAFDLDPARVWVFGYSNGATTAAALAVRHPDVLAGGVLLASRCPFRHHGRVLEAKPFFCGHGREDEIVSTNDYEDVVELLVTAGAEIELHWYDSGHELTDEQVKESTAWLLRQMDKKA